MVAELDALRTELMTELNERTEELRTESQAQHAAVMERLDGLAASYEERFDSLDTTIAEVKTTTEELKEEVRHLGLRFGLLEVRVGQLDARIGQINSWKMGLVAGGISGITILAAVAIAVTVRILIVANGG